MIPIGINLIHHITYLKGVDKMFDSLNNLLNTIFIEFRQLGMTIFAIGMLVMAVLTAMGGEENKRNFQKGFLISVIGLIVFFLVKPIIEFFRTNLM